MLVQEILDLKQASDKARLRSWDVFKSLYTIDSSSTELNFIGQRLDDEGAVIVSDTIDVFSSLQTLNLSENVVAAKGMEALSSNGLVMCVCVLCVCVYAFVWACERAFVCVVMCVRATWPYCLIACVCTPAPHGGVGMSSTPVSQDVADLSCHARK